MPSESLPLFEKMDRSEMTREQFKIKVSYNK